MTIINTLLAEKHGDDSIKSLDYVVQITTDMPQWGGLSGATLEEAISWGKVSPSAKKRVVYVDATIALPILVQGLIEEKVVRENIPDFSWFLMSMLLNLIRVIEMVSSMRKAISEDMIVGKHVYGDLYDIDKDVANNEEFLRKAVVKAAEIANMTLVDVKSWRFGGIKGGVLVLALVIESHIAVHTWPEYKYATVDVYTCGMKNDPLKAFEYLINILRPKRYTSNYIDRSSLKSKSTFTWRNM